MQTYYCQQTWFLQFQFGACALGTWFNLVFRWLVGMHDVPYVFDCICMPAYWCLQHGEILFAGIQSIPLTLSWLFLGAMLQCFENLWTSYRTKQALQHPWHLIRICLCDLALPPNNLKRVRGMAGVDFQKMSQILELSQNPWCWKAASLTAS